MKKFERDEEWLYYTLDNYLAKHDAILDELNIDEEYYIYRRGEYTYKRRVHKYRGSWRYQFGNKHVHAVYNMTTESKISYYSKNLNDDRFKIVHVETRDKFRNSKSNGARIATVIHKDTGFKFELRTQDLPNIGNLYKIYSKMPIYCNNCGEKNG